MLCSSPQQRAQALGDACATRPPSPPARDVMKPQEKLPGMIPLYFFAPPDQERGLLADGGSRSAVLYRRFAARMRTRYEMWLLRSVQKYVQKYRCCGLGLGFSVSQSHFSQSCFSASPLQSSRGKISAPSASVHEFPERFHSGGDDPHRCLQELRCAPGHPSPSVPPPHVPSLPRRAQQPPDDRRITTGRLQELYLE